MEELKKLLMDLENLDENKFVLKEGNNSVLLTSVHSMIQNKKDRTYKLNEPLTKPYSKYISLLTGSSYFIKTKDDGIDPNAVDSDEFKEKLVNYINEKNIKLVLDIHGASRKHNFDIELGTLDGFSTKPETINLLKETLRKYGIKNIKENEPFKGGKITKSVYFKTSSEVIQLEINRNYRDLDNMENVRKIIEALTEFIKNFN